MTLHRVALSLGRTVEELGEEMTSSELTDWMAFERIHGPLHLGQRLDVLVGHLCYVVAISAGAKVKPADFEVRWDGDRPARPDSVQRGFDTLLEMARAQEAARANH